MPAIEPKTPTAPASPRPIDAPSPDEARAAGEAAQGVVTEATAADSPLDRAVVGAGRAQALSMAMVDAAAHLRRVETLSLAAMATGLEAILAGDTERGGAALEAADAALDKAIGRLRSIVALAAGDG